MPPAATFTPEIQAISQTALGIPRGPPTGAVVLDRKWFVVSYEPKKNAAEWVAWRLAASDLGSVPRSNRFHTDDSLDATFYRTTPMDFARSGYDRGHLCPSGDRTASPEMNYATFMMTNMQAQRHDLNAGPWEALESFSRDRARAHKVLYIVAGGLFSAVSTTIGHGVAVPTKSYKVLAVLDGDGPSAVRADTETVAVIMPNEAGILERPWTDYTTTIDDVEAQTGLDFFDRVPVDVQAAIESRVWTKK